jgi:hypothetical protein
MIRDAEHALPAAGAPIDLDRPPFITQGLGPDGAVVRYYNFDIQPAHAGLRYRFVQAGGHEPIAGQLDVIDAIPGDDAYGDFWQLAWVEVPADFVPGSITRADQIRARGLPIERSPSVVDCPVVPAGTTARRGGAVMRELFYRDARVSCVELGEPLTSRDGRVPTSPIYVTFAINPGAAGGGPPSGFRREPDLVQTHNVVFSVPGDTDYSPLWAVHVYDHEAFARVHDASSALAAPLVDGDGPLVNCPIAEVLPR